MSLREFTTKNIFEPLGMTHTHFRDDHEEIIKHDALGYEQDGTDKPFRMNLTNFDTAGATSLHTTVEDLQLWDENFYHPQVGGAALIQQMLERGKLNSGELQDLRVRPGASARTWVCRPWTTQAPMPAIARTSSDSPSSTSPSPCSATWRQTNPSALARQVADIVLARDLKAPAPVPAKEPGTAARH